MIQDAGGKMHDTRFMEMRIAGSPLPFGGEGWGEGKVWVF